MFLRQSFIDISKIKTLNFKLEAFIVLG